MNRLTKFALAPFHIVRKVASYQPLTNATKFAAYIDITPNIIIAEHSPGILKPIAFFRADVHRKCWDQVLWFAEFADTAVELLAAEQIEPRL